MPASRGQLPPSETLPGIEDNQVVYHNGEGYYYVCEEFNLQLKERLFKCVKGDCEVTAKMGPMHLGYPLIDMGSHSHPADVYYKQKCVLLHTIKRKFILENVPAFTILQNVLESYFADFNIQPCTSADMEVPIEESKQLFLDIFGEENECIASVSSDVDSSSSQAIEADDHEPVFVLQPVKQTYKRKAINLNVANSENLLNNSVGLSNQNHTTSSQIESSNLGSVTTEQNSSTSEPFDDVFTDNFKEEPPDDLSIKMEFVDVGQEIGELLENNCEKQVISHSSSLLSENTTNLRRHIKGLKVRTDLKPKMKRKRQAWDELKLLQALTAVSKNESSIKRASRTYQIPRSTLKRHLKNFKTDLRKFTYKKPGRPRIFPSEVEEKLVAYCLKMKNSTQVYTYCQVARFAYALSEELGLKTCFNTKTKIAGRRWLKVFLERHPECKKNATVQEEVSILDEV